MTIGGVPPNCHKPWFFAKSGVDMICFFLCFNPCWSRPSFLLGWTHWPVESCWIQQAYLNLSLKLFTKWYPKNATDSPHRIPGNPILENSMTNPIHPTKTIPKNPNPDPSDLNCQTSFLDCAAADASAAEVQKLLDLAISHGISHMELSNSSLYP